MIRVLIVDDHPILRRGLSDLLSLEVDIEVAGEAADGATAVRMAPTLRPDVIVMDLRLPGLSGPDAIEQICDQASAADPPWSPRIVVLTTFEDDQSITAAIEAGALGYVLKSAPPDEIIQAVRMTSEGRSVLSPSVTAAVVRQMHHLPTIRSLSPREREVLACLVAGQSNAEIAAQLFVEASTVKTHLEHIFDKLGATGRTQAIARAHELGLA